MAWNRTFDFAMLGWRTLLIFPNYNINYTFSFVNSPTSSYHTTINESLIRYQKIRIPSSASTHFTHRRFPGQGTRRVSTGFDRLSQRVFPATAPLDSYAIIEHIYYFPFTYSFLFVFFKTNTNGRNHQRCRSLTRTTPHIGPKTLKSPVRFHSFLETNTSFPSEP